MKAYHVDQLEPSEIIAITNRLTAMQLESSMTGLFWLPVPSKLLTATQQEHAAQCGPYVLALEVEEDALHLELLVRAQNKIRCECVHYAGVELRNHMIEYVDTLLAELGICC